MALLRIIVWALIKRKQFDQRVNPTDYNPQDTAWELKINNCHYAASLAISRA